jgi:preprotein translocase subunit SecG
MLYFILGLILFVAILLVLVVLVQNKGGGLTTQFIGAGAGQILGVKRTGDLLEQLTWGFISAILVLTLASNFFIDREQAGEARRTVNQERAAEKSTLNNMQPTAPQTAPTADSVK